ncbi:MAG: ribonuclease Z [Nanoarchaeota archaeon]
MAEKIKLVFLGTSDGVPTKKRNHTSILLNYKEENIMIDCGEGTQRQMRKADLNLCKITRILITHWHADHVLGIPGLLKTLEISGYNKILNIYGPIGTRNKIENLLSLFKINPSYEINIHEVSSGKFLDLNEFYLTSEKAKHRISCNAYSFVLKDKIKINKDKLKKLKIPQGEFLKNLSKGKDIKYEGKKYKSKNLTYKEKGKKICFIFDTKKINNLIKLAKDSDLLISEATFSEEIKERAEEYLHLTGKQAGEIAKKSKSKKLLLAHISGRYESDGFKKILREAKSVFNNTEVVKDLDIIEIK